MPDMGQGKIYQTGATDNGGNRGMYKVIVIDDETLAVSYTHLTLPTT